MVNPIQTIKIAGTPTKKTLPKEIVERLAPRPITVKESVSSQTPPATMPLIGNTQWLYCLIDKYVNAQAEHRERSGLSIEQSRLDEFTLDTQRQINLLVSQLQPRVNPNNEPLEVYYFGAGSDYIEVAAATNAAKLVLAEIDFFNVDDPLEMASLAQPYYEDIAQTIKWIGGQIIEREVNIIEPKYIPCEDSETKYFLGTLIEAGILELNEGEVLTVELEINEGNKHGVSILRVSNEVFLTNSGFAFAIEKLNSDEKKYQIEMIKFGTGTIKLKCQVPLFTTTPAERPQDITYHSCMDANTSIPDEIKDGYDVLFAKECYILNDNETKQRLYDLLRLGGKAIFTTCTHRTIEDLKIDFPMFDFNNSVTIPICDSAFGYVIVEK